MTTKKVFSATDVAPAALYAKTEADSQLATPLLATTAGSLKVSASIDSIDPSVLPLEVYSGFNIPDYDWLQLFYVSSGNGFGEIGTVVFKTGGSGGTTVGILSLTYDVNDKLSTVTLS